MIARMGKLLLVLSAVFPLVAVAQARPKVAVLDFTANGASKELASAAGSAVANELERLGAFQVITSEAIRSLLAFEKQKEMLGCSDNSCLADIGGALGADYVVSGKVTKLRAAGSLPEIVSLDLTLSSVRKGSREGSASETAGSEAELVPHASRAVAKLVQKLLVARGGWLVVSAEEVGAVVKVDEQIKGTTPLKSAISLPAGPHTLGVEKRGFVTYERDIRIEPTNLLDEPVHLVPSPDFVKEYESSQSKIRLGAWISTGVAFAGATGAVALQVIANNKYGNESSPGTFLYLRQQILNGTASSSVAAQASSLRSSIDTEQTLSYVAAGVAAAGAVAATYFWISGEDPGRYAAYREVAKLDVSPTKGGALAMMTFAF